MDSPSNSPTMSHRVICAKRRNEHTQKQKKQSILPIELFLLRANKMNKITLKNIVSLNVYVMRSIHARIEDILFL